MLDWLNEAGASSYVFFRRCTLPSQAILDSLAAGGHNIGLHLENSRSFETFLAEKERLERHVGRKVVAMSKHGSGRSRFGLSHYAPYEPEKYVEWAGRSGMNLFLGNLEDPRIEPTVLSNGLRVFPSAFWLEPHWRDSQRFTVPWLEDYASNRDVVLLVHPENVLASQDLVHDFRSLINSIEARMFA